MATTRPRSGPGAFQWNAGAWFGSLLGSTAWMLVGAVIMATRAPVVSLAWLSCFALSLGVGIWLWSKRGRIRPYPAIQGMLLAVGVSGLLAFALLDGLGTGEDFGLLGTPREGYRAMLIVPGLMAWFASLEWACRRRSAGGGAAG
jgi:hypothetical protein